MSSYTPLRGLKVIGMEIILCKLSLEFAGLAPGPFAGFLVPRYRP